MKPGKVVGKVTLHAGDPAFRGARWLLVSPMGAEELDGRNPSGISRESSPVVYDNLGAGLGDEILYVEGAEATQPFDHPIPIDAINVALLDRIHYAHPA
jgi:microcompartment protein CcmK/EutM